MNKKFKNKIRTYQECKNRSLNLKINRKKDNNENWNLGEECILIYNFILHRGNWDKILSNIPGRERSEIEKHLLTKIRSMCKEIPSYKTAIVRVQNIFELFQKFSILKLILDILSGLYCISIDELKTITKKDCYNHLKLISKLNNIEIEWSEEILENYILSVLERIKNNKVLVLNDTSVNEAVNFLEY